MVIKTISSKEIEELREKARKFDEMTAKSEQKTEPAKEKEIAVEEIAQEIEEFEVNEEDNVCAECNTALDGKPSHCPKCNAELDWN